MNLIKVHAFWDDQARVWVAESDDVPGLATEAETIPELVIKLETLIPELLDANGHLSGSDVEFDLEAKYHGITHRMVA